MPDQFFYKALYTLQDRVLRLVEHWGTDFYLTGGTALSRHYLKHRYSDDLDFFVNQSPLFKQQTAQIVRELQTAFTSKVRTGLVDDNFVRLFVQDTDVELKLEFVNDVGYRAGDSVDTPLFNKLDNWRNILSNKITALQRNAAKDYADIICIARAFSFTWETIIQDAKNKDMWVNEIEVSAIVHNFAAEKLNVLTWIKEMDVTAAAKDLELISRDILLGRDNSLCPQAT